MKIANLSLPLPVLGVHDDIGGSYDISGPDVVTKPEITEISLVHMLRNHEIQSLIDSDNAEFVAHTHCQKTSYRKCFTGSEQKHRFSIPSDDLRDKVELEFFVVAKKDIADYKPQSAHPDYSGFVFQPRKGDILAHAGTTNFVAHKQYMTSDAVGSFMVLEEGNYKSGPIKIDLGRDKIAITLSKTDFERYKLLSKAQRFDRIFHSAVVFPALIYAITQFINSRGSYDDRKWFQVIQDRKQNDPELSSESWDTGNVPKIAQKLLGNPLDRTLGALTEMTGVDQAGSQ